MGGKYLVHDEINLITKTKTSFYFKKFQTSDIDSSILKLFKIAI